VEINKFIIIAKKICSAAKKLNVDWLKTDKMAGISNSKK